MATLGCTLRATRRDAQVRRVSWTRMWLTPALEQRRAKCRAKFRGLVYAGLHLSEAHPSWAKEIQKKCEDGVRVRVAFGDPESMQVRARGEEEGVGEGLAARIRYALAWHRQIFGSPNLSIAFHSTVLYNSILRFGDQMLVNPHIYSMPAFRAPILHLRRIDGGPLFNTYVECFEHVWAQSRPFDMESNV